MWMWMWMWNNIVLVDNILTFFKEINSKKNCEFEFSSHLKFYLQIFIYIEHNNIIKIIIFSIHK